MRSPLRYFGSKFRLIPELLALLPTHECWTEVFGGGAGLTIAKQPSPVETYNDLYGDIVQFFRVLQDPTRAQELHRRAWFTPYSREWFESMRDSVEEPADEIDRAYRFMVVNRMAFGGWSGDPGKKRPSWSYSTTLNRADMAASVDVWQGGVDMLLPVCERLRNVQIENLDFRDLVRRYDQSDNGLFYFDPPYHPAVRVRGGYRHEMTDADHRDLTDLCLSLKGMGILSGYRYDPIHGPLEAAGWERRDFETRVFCSGKAARKNRRVESIWLCPKTQERLRARGQLALFGDEEAAARAAMEAEERRVWRALLLRLKALFEMCDDEWPMETALLPFALFENGQTVQESAEGLFKALPAGGG